MKKNTHVEQDKELIELRRRLAARQRTMIARIADHGRTFPQRCTEDTDDDTP